MQAVVVVKAEDVVAAAVVILVVGVNNKLSSEHPTNKQMEIQVNAFPIKAFALWYRIIV